MKKRTQVFSYKGFIGIQSDVEAEGLLNKPLESGQLGFVVLADCVDITPEALELLKTIKKSGDDIGDVDAYKSDEGLIFSWLGANKQIVRPKHSSVAYDTDMSLLTKTVDIEVPQGFKDFVDDMLIEEKKG